MATEPMNDAKSALGMIKDITPLLERWAASGTPEPTQVAAIAGPVKGSSDAYEEMLELRTELMKQSTANLDRMIGYQLAKGAREGQGTPLWKWLSGDRAS